MTVASKLFHPEKHHKISIEWKKNYMMIEKIHITIPHLLPILVTNIIELFYHIQTAIDGKKYK